MSSKNYNNYSFPKTSIFFIVLLSLLHFQFSNAVKGGYWSPGDLEASEIDSTLYTHLLCAFAGIDKQTYQLKISSECSTFPQTIRQKNPAIKALLSIGGSGATSTSFNTMASHTSTRKAFIESSISQALSAGFDGLDLDWENQNTTEEMNYLATLLNELREGVRAESSRTGATPLILTAALRFRPTTYNGISFPIQAISNSLDWVNIMAYDFYAPSSTPKPLLTRSHAALKDPISQASGSFGVRAWISAGMPANKLVLGVPYYGYGWSLTNQDDNGLLAPANGIDTSVGNDGQPSYKEIKDFISQKDAIVVYNTTYVTNYCFSGTTWITYDDTESIAAKVAYAKDNALLGYFAWNIVQDSDWALSTIASQTWGAER